MGVGVVRPDAAIASLASGRSIELLDVLCTRRLTAVADCTRSGLGDWGLGRDPARPVPLRPGADEAAVAVLRRRASGVLSEESGVHDGEPSGPRSPWSIPSTVRPTHLGACRGTARASASLDEDGPRVAALVVNQASGVRYEAVRGGGARRDGQAIRPSACDGARAGGRRPLRVPAALPRLGPVPGARGRRARPVRRRRRDAATPTWTAAAGRCPSRCTAAIRRMPALTEPGTTWRLCWSARRPGRPLSTSSAAIS